MSKADNKSVNENDLKELFWAVVDNLKECLKDRSAGPKDKEIALKLVSDYQIGIEIPKGEHVAVLDEPLPFDEIGVHN